MVYHYEISRNRRLLVLPIVAVILVAVSLTIAVFWIPLVGLLSFFVTGYFGYQLVKYFRNQVKSVIHVTDEGVHGTTAVGSKYSISWEGLSLAGEFIISGQSQDIFLYSDEADQLIRIQPLYSHPEEMAREIEEKAAEYVRWEGLKMSDLETRLRDRFTDKSTV